MSWMLFAIPWSVAAGDSQTVRWLSDAGISPPEVASRAPSMAEVRDALLATGDGNDGVPGDGGWFFQDRIDSPRRVGEVSVWPGEGDWDAPVDHVTFRSPDTVAALVVVRRLAELTGPWIAFADYCMQPVLVDGATDPVAAADDVA